MAGNISIRGARVNNLKNIDLEIPRGRLVVVTGISGSGKSSLAFDTLYAEGQRRFAQSVSSYARQFLGRMTKPDVDLIDGIPPAIAIEQKVSVKNPRSTVGTTTEIYDFLRLVFSRIGHTFSPVSGGEVKADSVQDVLSFMEGSGASVFYILADVRWDWRDDKVELMLSLKEQGYSRMFAGGEVRAIDDILQKGGDYPGGAMLLIDRLRLQDPADIRTDSDLRTRLLQSVGDAFDRGGGDITVVCDGRAESFCNRFELDGMAFRKPDEYLLSFNSPLGACPVCGGLGKIIGISEDLVVPDKSKSIYDGAIACWRGDKMGWFKDHLVHVASRYGIRPFEPYCNLSDKERDIIWNGHSEPGDDDSIVGINEFFEWVHTQRYKIQYKFMESRFSGRTVCTSCHGSRLRSEALYVKVGGKNIHEWLCMTVDELIVFMDGLELEERERTIAAEPLREIRSRLQYIQEVGLGYLTLSRAFNTLSGGESQRINLVTALGSSLVGSMYILDEPSIGLHPRDTERLIGVLRRLRDLGNTVIVVEHDENIIRAADLLIDMGPQAGVNGGEVVFKGKASGKLPAKAVDASLTLQYLSGVRKRYMREKRPWNYYISVEGAMEHNLKDIDVKFPLRALTVVTGVSGSGKSSLVGDILYPALCTRMGEGGEVPGTHKGLGGNLDRISRVEYVDQNPIGKSSRSNAVTYLKVYDEIRKLLSDQQYAKINGYGPSYFSFNQEGGRCPECQGDGVVTIQMQFMADITMVCEECGGRRFKPDILEVRYRGKNIDDILNMSVDEAIDFFSLGREESAKAIARKLQPLVDVGLGYIKLGQSSSTLSGGESQRIKLAYFLSLGEGGSRRQENNRILFLFDEPTTGLHFFDVEKLLKSFDALLDAGHSIIVVEHNTDVIRNADWVIDLGPDAGADGGTVVFEGTPEDMIAGADTFTARYLRSL
ncbi:MAG: excinuclease ABC subunit UvrA [Bacteroidales bacterium]|nr:excinuclease ABC subunit UvrA [Bacteroidales bacterium]